MRQESLKENAILTDREPYLYVECARIDQEDSSLCMIQKNKKMQIPVTGYACLILGPGVSITHRAIEAVSDSGTVLIWMGEHFRAFYATGMQEDRSSKNILRQIKLFEDPNLHMQVVRKMYEKRFAGSMPTKGYTLEELRGMEGQRMKGCYQEFSDKYHVPWTRRDYDLEWDLQDKIQQALTVGNKLLYNISHAAIVILGHSPVIGFIHTGTMRSFVYDIADLYKTRYVIPVAFEAVANEQPLSYVRQKIRDNIEHDRLFTQIIKDLTDLFDIAESSEGTLQLWDSCGNKTAGYNYNNSS